MEELFDVIARGLKEGGLGKALGIELVSLDSSGCTLRIAPDDRHLNLLRVIHGGVVAALADTAIGLAFLPARQHRAGLVTPTTTLTVDFVSRVPIGTAELRATARVLRAGKHTGFAEVDVLADGVLVAKALGTVASVPHRG